MRYLTANLNFENYPFGIENGEYYNCPPAIAIAGRKGEAAKMAEFFKNWRRSLRDV